MRRRSRDAPRHGGEPSAATVIASEIQRLLRQAFLAGTVYLPRERPQPGRRRGKLLARAVERFSPEVLPDVFDRFNEAAARVSEGDLDALLTSENLNGLTPVFAQLGLLRERVGHSGARDRHRPTRGGAGQDQEPDRLRRTRGRSISRGGVRQGAFRLGLRRCASVRGRAAARGESRPTRRLRRSTQQPRPKRAACCLTTTFSARPPSVRRWAWSLLTS